MSLTWPKKNNSRRSNNIRPSEVSGSSGSALGRAYDPHFALKIGMRSVHDLIDGLQIVGSNQDPNNAIKHILLLYEEPEFARMLQCKFLAKGLKEGASCACLAHDKSEVDIIKREMFDNGIDVNSYLNSNRLKVKILPNNDSLFQLPALEGSAKNEYHFTLDLMHRISAYLNEDMKPPIVGAGIVIDSAALYDSHDNDDRFLKSMHFQLELEKAGQKFTKLPSSSGLWMCPYFIKDISYSLDNDPLVQQLLLYHDAVIYATKDWNGIALNLIDCSPIDRANSCLP